LRLNYFAANIFTMENPYEILAARLSNIENMLLEIKQTPKHQSERIGDKEAAEMIGCKPTYLAQLRHRNVIPYLRAGKFVSYLRVDIEAYCRSNRVPTKEELAADAMLAQSSKKKGLENGK
jgi:hypothetical protein